MKPLTLTPEEIKSLASGRVVIWRVMEPQPEVIRNYHVINQWGPHTKFRWKTYETENYKNMGKVSPYQPGAEFWVRETWPIYPADDIYGKVKWKTPQQMPRLASCYTVRVVSVSPEQRDTWGWRVELEVV